MSYKKLKECVICGYTNLEKYIDLGEQPLANNLLNSENEVAKKFPLAVNFCHNCYHSQLTVSIDPALMFKHYLYATGTSKIINEYFKNFVDYIEAKFPNKKLKVLEIASNDGTLLRHFKDRGHTVLGVDPAENLAALAELNGIPTIPKFWNEYTANELNGNKYDVIIAQNVLAHVPNPVEFMEACKSVLEDDGIISIQTSQANMFNNFEFDTVYHEHLSFFNANSFDKLGYFSGLNVTNIKKVPIHGDSYLVEYSKESSPDTNIYDVIRTEKINAETFRIFKNKFNDICNTVLNEIRNLPKDYVLCGFGAAAKGITFLNHIKLKLNFIVDDTPYKQNKFTPGLAIPIMPRSELEKYNKLAIIVLPWNFYNNIKEQIDKIKHKEQEIILISYFPTFKVEKLK